MLDLLDKELEKRGHKFVLYADDCNIYVKTRKAGVRVKLSIELFEKKRKIDRLSDRELRTYIENFEKLKVL